MNAKITKASAEQFVDMLNDYCADDRVELPGIPFEEARELPRAALDKRIHAMLKEVVEVLRLNKA